MNIQTGIDLCSIPRMEQSLQNPRFLHKVFSPKEQALILAKTGALQAATAAANFAAKEAFSKALGTGVRGFSLAEVEILRDGLGRPYLELTGKANALAQQIGLCSFSVSLSHEGELAAAVVVAYSG